jgi:ketopantoate hydroxymethyltransferase
MEQKPVCIEATLMWPFLNKPNDMSGKYQVDLTNLSDKAVKALEDMGISVRNKEGKGFYITAKSNHEIKALDKNGDQVMAHIGNGTKAVCVMGSYSWTFKNKKGVSPSLKKLVITDLVTYSAQPKQDEEETEDVL